MTVSELGSLMRYLGKEDEALKYLKTAYDGFVLQLGADHNRSKVALSLRDPENTTVLLKAAASSISSMSDELQNLNLEVVRDQRLLEALEAHLKATQNTVHMNKVFAISFHGVMENRCATLVLYSHYAVVFFLSIPLFSPFDTELFAGSAALAVLAQVAADCSFPMEMNITLVTDSLSAKRVFLRSATAEQKNVSELTTREVMSARSALHIQSLRRALREPNKFSIE